VKSPLLLDTCAALWYWAGSPRLSETAAELIIEAENEVRIHQITYLEITLKYSLGKLDLGEPPATLIPKAIEQSGFQFARLGNRDIARLESLPFHHRDPFDRLLIAHALEHDLAVLTADNRFTAYGVEVLW